MLAQNAYTPRTHYLQTLNRMGWSMLIFIGLFNTTTTFSTTILAIKDYVTSPLWNAILTALYGVLASLCYIAPFFLTGLIYYAMSRRIRTERLSLDLHIPREFPLWVFVGLAVLTAAAYINSQFCTLIGYTVPIDMLTSGAYDSPTVVIQYMTVAIAPAFAEEFLFRGVFYTNLRPFGRTQAVLISALLFALMHQNIGQLFYTFVAGIAMALMFEMTGSIWCSVVFHLINNELSVLSEVLYYGRYGEAAEPYLSILDAVVFLLGIFGMILLVLYYKKQAAARAATRVCGIYGRGTGSIGRCERSVDAKTVTKGMLTPGMVIFTVTTVALMGITWIFLALMNGGLPG